jgi:hypothetical protein
VIGERLDDYLVERLDPQRLLLRSELVAPGVGWIEWRVSPLAGSTAQAGRQLQVGTRLVQTAYFAPRGFPGFAYWVLLAPFHRLALRRLLRAILQKVVKSKAGA